MSATRTFGEKALAFYKRLRLLEALPGGVEVMNPYRRPEVLRCVQQFLQRFFHDQRSRVYALGINPGRFGAGVTGITFSDPVVTAVSPLGFIHRGRNYNYYEEPRVFRAVEPFIVESLKRQLACGARRDVAILLGTGRNQDAFAKALRHPTGA